MTGGRCHRRKKMMGRGAEGGCGAEEKPCRPVHKASGNTSSIQTENPRKATSVDINFFSQARKALSERSPYDLPEDGSSSGLSVTTLPSGLASLLKQSDSRKSHKKSHAGVDKKKSSRQGASSRGGRIWFETEEYFRDLGLPDIDALSALCSFDSLAARNCFSIPLLGNQRRAEASINLDGNATFELNENKVNAIRFTVKEDVKHVVKEELKDVSHKEELKEVNVQFADVPNAGADRLLQEETVCSVSDSCSSLEWLLSCRNRILLTSERPSKKRKLLGSDAGLEKILIARPCDGNSSLCHFCCTGDTDKEFNRLIVCSSCKVAVHLKCYGVQENFDEAFLCPWCEVKDDVGDLVKPCFLCPKQGGALKPVQNSVEKGGSVEFAHLFCALWMPEVYIEEISSMEPIMNMGGIQESRMKLVCNVCKVKYGACIRCSHGACRASFHPICAREANHRLEVWGKYGCDHVELRAFCSRHSDLKGRSTSIRPDVFAVDSNESSGTNHLPSTFPHKKSHKLKNERQNADEIAIQQGTLDTNSGISQSDELQEITLSDLKSNARSVSDCSEAHQLVKTGMLEKNNGEGAKQSDSFNFVLVLKKLIDRGKVNVKDVASEIGISSDSLSATVADGSMVPDLRCKIVQWLRNHAYMGNWQKNSRVKMKGSLSKAENGVADCTDGVTVSDSDISDSVTVKSVPPRRRTKSNIRIVKESKIVCSTDEVINDNGVVMDEVKADKLIKEGRENSRTSVPDTTDKNLTITTDMQDSLRKHSTKVGGSPAKASCCSLSEGVEPEESTFPEQNASLNLDQGIPICSDLNPVVPDLIKRDAFSGCYVHPYIRKELLRLHRGMFFRNRISFESKKTTSSNDSLKGEVSQVEASSNASVCCNHNSQTPECNDIKCKGVNMDQLVNARKMGILELSPEDEVEGEIIYFQHRLLGNAVARKQLTDNLVCKVAKSLPHEIDLQRRQGWEAVLANQYLYELKEAKKQGRKERKHKEAQALLVAATAAAAASSRISSLRKDASEDSANQENFLKTNTSNARAGTSSQVMPRAKETLSRMALSRTSSEKNSDYIQAISDHSKEHPRSCDVCRRSETEYNRIFVCSSCKVAVHLDCYRSVKRSTGQWYCEICEEQSSRSSGAPTVNFWEKPYIFAECGLCGGTTGAFRKSTDGRWVHAFCAEWVFESSFRRGQITSVQGMDTVPMGVDVCCICRRKHGACIKCSYGHCRTTFHPTCARSSGFFMTGGGKFQHKAYCEKHSLEQKAKAETQKHGDEELKSLKQIRVGLERLRLICERIIKREKIKREFVLCSHELLAAKRDNVARSVLVHSPFFPPEVSSESATTSLKGQTDGYRLCFEGTQRSDDNTVDSALSVKRRIKVPIPMEKDQKTEDNSSTSQKLVILKPPERKPFSGKQIPQRHSLASHKLCEDGECSSKSKKNLETFEKELVMTSDEASMKNQRLPKGYCYIPVDRLQKKQMTADASSVEPMEEDE